VSQFLPAITNWRLLHQGASINGRPLDRPGAHDLSHDVYMAVLEGRVDPDSLKETIDRAEDTRKQFKKKAPR
jgi:hypothetical protein